MFYFNKIKQKNIQYKKVNYASFANGINTDYDENLLPVKYATTTYNFCYQNGALKTGLGIKDVALKYDKSDREKTKNISLPNGVEALATYTYIVNESTEGTYLDMLMIYGSDKKIYAYFMYFDSPSYVVLDVEFSSIPMVTNYNINGKDCILMVTPEDGMYVWDGITLIKKIEDAPKITSMCIHYERMFATVSDDSKSIYFSDDLDPTNWSQSLSEGGFISLMDERGACKKIVSFNDSIYIFREYGIDRMVAYADQTEFRVEPLFTSSTRIYTDTILVCGDRIMFLAMDGIYYFTGVNTSKYNLKINSLFSSKYNDSAKATYYNGKYYLACNLSMPDDELVGCEKGEYDNNILIELDPRSGEINILRGYDIVNLQTLNNRVESKLLICTKIDGKNRLGELCEDGMIFGIPTRKVWKSPKTNFGEPLREKLIKSISINTDSDITILIRADNKKYAYKVCGSSGISTIFPNIKAKQIAIDFVCEKSLCNISSPEVVIGVV